MLEVSDLFQRAQESRSGAKLQRSSPRSPRAGIVNSKGALGKVWRSGRDLNPSDVSRYLLIP
jgi:hypothetical protein